MLSLLYPLKQAWAGLSRKPGFIATVVTTMGTTLGALLCVLTLGYFLLIEPLPYPEQQHLYKVEHKLFDKNGAAQGAAFTYPGLMHLYQQQDVFEPSALVHYGEDVLTSAASQPTMHTAYVTPEWFSMLGAKVAIGRMFETSEALDSFNPVAVLSYQTWQQMFNGDPQVLQTKVNFSGVSFTVVGVLSEQFVEPQIAEIGRKTGIWLPWDYNQDIGLKERWGNISGGLNFVGKLKNAVTPHNAEQAITPLVNDIWVEKLAGIDFFSGWHIKLETISLQERILGDSQQTLILLFFGVIGLVIIATANIANLFMSRTAEQQRQLAIYAALGAKPRQLFNSLFAETSVLMLLSVLLALLIAVVGFNLMQAFLADILPRVESLRLNAFTFVSAALLALLFAGVFAGLSRRMIQYRALNTMLQSSGKGTGIQVSKTTRQTLIVSQVAIATVLVFANLSLFKQAYDTIHQDRGFSVDNMMDLSLSISAQTYPDREVIKPLVLELQNKLTELPQVESVSISSSVLSRFSWRGLTTVPDGENFTPRSKHIDEKYFEFTEQLFLEGDNFSKADVQDRNRVMIVNDVFAKLLAPNGSAIGAKVSTGWPEPMVIKGVVKSIKLPSESEIPPRVYSTVFPSSTHLTIKLVPGQHLSREQVVEVLADVSSLFAVFSLETLKDMERGQLFTQYATAVTTAVLATLTLFLAGVGLYGILSYGTQMRRFELGTRMAIGAKKKELVHLLVKDNAKVILLGMFVSIGPLLGLYVSNIDMLASYMSISLVFTFSATLLAIASLSLFACYWPLRQYVNQPAIYSLRGSE